jgi:regulator of sigma E protease
MGGAQPGEQNDDPRSFLNKPRWQRLIIAFAGSFMNIVLAVAILTGLYMVKFPKFPEAAQGLVGLVMPNSAAAKAGIREGDRVISFDHKPNPAWEDIMLKEISSAGLPIDLTVLRGSQQIALTVTPEMDQKAGVGSIGWAEQAEIQIGGVEKGMDAERKGLHRGDILLFANGQPIRSSYRLREIVRASQGRPVEVVYSRNGQHVTTSLSPVQHEYDGQKVWMIGVRLEPRVQFIQLGFGDALAESMRQNLKSAAMIYSFIERMIEGRMSPKSLEGPIRIAQLSGDAAREGADVFFGLMVMVSLNLAVFNLLPIPILDGGVILLLLIEMVKRRDLSLQFKENVMKFGLVFLVGLVVFVIYNDVSKVLPKS